jgi:hypothetical protein
MKQPCNNCPFLKANTPKFALRRADEIAASLFRDQEFPCHKTVHWKDDGTTARTEKTKACFGAALFLEHAADGGCRSNMMFRLAIAAAHFSAKDLRLEPTVCSSVKEFVELSKV